MAYHGGGDSVPNSVPYSLIEKAKRYTPNDYPKKTNDGYVIAHVDGCCLNNGLENARAGVGVWFGENHPL
jgi:hypothetical protein